VDDNTIKISVAPTRAVALTTTVPDTSDDGVDDDLNIDLLDASAAMNEVFWTVIGLAIVFIFLFIIVCLHRHRKKQQLLAKAAAKTDGTVLGTGSADNPFRSTAFASSVSTVIAVSSAMSKWKKNAHSAAANRVSGGGTAETSLASPTGAVNPRVGPRASVAHVNGDGYMDVSHEEEQAMPSYIDPSTLDAIAVSAVVPSGRRRSTQPAPSGSGGGGSANGAEEYDEPPPPVQPKRK
jgi:hypothetical protein